MFWSACTQGSYGPGCKQQCTCDHNAPCHHITGTCICPAGWRGVHCEKSNLPNVHLVCPLLVDPEYCNSSVLFQFVYLVHMGSDALSDATVLVALPVTMWPGSVAAHLDLLVTAASEVSDYILISLHSWWNIFDSLSVVKHQSCCPGSQRLLCSSALQCVSQVRSDWTVIRCASAPRLISSVTLSLVSVTVLQDIKAASVIQVWPSWSHLLSS